MISYDIFKRRKGVAHRIFCGFLAFTFLFSWVLPPGYAQSIGALNLPAPGAMVTPTPGFTPALINGITIHPENPLEFDFIVGTGDEKLQGKAFEDESTKLIKYFLAALTVPEDEMWVNLSPYEKDRIIPEGFGTTEMGRDLLAQDYILKQLTASLMYPEKELGSEFWKKIYQKAREQYGTTEIPVNTFNKVWIVPEKAIVYEHGNSAFVVKSRLKVMLESDYIAQKPDSRSSMLDARGPSSIKHPESSIETEIVREVILPEIEKEVNEGKGFANLRQIYHSAILAAWFKQNLRQTLLGQVYVDQAKTKGVDVEDKTVNQKIYEQYLEAFKKGVYNYIKEDYDPATQEVIPRKYFSGGTNLKVGDLVETYKNGQNLSMLQQQILKAYMAGQSSDQQEVNIKLLELSQKTSVADAQKAVASSRQAAKKSSSPVAIDIRAYEKGGSGLAAAKMNILNELAERYGKISDAENLINEAESVANEELVSLDHSTEGFEKVTRGTASVEDKQAYLQSRMRGEWAKFLPAGGDATRLGVKEQKVLLDLKDLLGDAREEELGEAIEKALRKREITQEQIEELGELRESVRDELRHKTIIARILESEARMLGGNEKVLQRQTYILAPSAGHEQKLADELSRNGYFGFKREAFFILPQEQEPKYRQKDGTVVAIDKTKAGGNGVPIVNIVLEGKGYTIGEDGRLVRYSGKASQYAKQRGAKYIYQGTIGDLRPWIEDPLHEEFAGRIFRDLSSGKIAAAAEYVQQNPTLIQKGGTVFYNRVKGLLEFVEKLAMGRMLGRVDFEKQPLATFNHIFAIKALESARGHRIPLYVRVEDGEFFTELVGGDIVNILQSNGYGVAHVERRVRIHELKGTASLIPTVRTAYMQDTGRKYLEEKPLTDVSLKKWIKGAAPGDKALPALIALNKETDMENLPADVVFSLVAFYRYFDPEVVGSMLDHEGMWDFDVADRIFKRFKDILTGHPEVIDEIKERMAGRQTAGKPLTAVSLKGWMKGAAPGDKALLALIALNEEANKENLSADAVFSLVALYRYFDPSLVGSMLDQGTWDFDVVDKVLQRFKDVLTGDPALINEINGKAASSPIDGKMAMTEVPDSEWEGRTVFIRTDFNVPLDEQGKIADDSRIQASLETIRYVLERGARVVIGSHLGDPWGEIRKLEAKYRQGGLSREAAAGRAGEEIFKKMSLSAVAQRLQELLPGVKVHFQARYNWVMSDASDFIQGKMKPGEVFLLENVRFNPEEKGKKDIYFAGDLMKGADIIVSDGFSVAHRSDVSVTGSPGKDVPRVAGPAFVREVRALKDVRDNARTIVIGGSKVSSKIGVIREFLKNPNVGKIMVGGGMANAFFVAKGLSVGATVVGTEPVDVDIARTLLDNSKVVTPSDVVAVDNFGTPTRSKVINFENREAVPDGWVIIDIGPATIATYQEIIARDGLTFWNGPMGAFDVKSVAQFARKGTNGVGEAVADARGVVGGGDTVNAVNLFGLTGYSYISTAGGAALEFLEGKELPGIAALSDKIISSAGGQEVLPPVDDEGIVLEVPALEITDFLKPGVGVADALAGYWQAGGRGPVSLQEITVTTGLEKEFVLAAINRINGNFSSLFSVDPAGLNKRLDGQTQWVQLVARRPPGEFRSLSPGLQPRASSPIDSVRKAPGAASPRQRPGSSPIEGLEVALVGGGNSDVVRNMQLIGQLLAANESSRILVGGVTALVLMEAKGLLDRDDYTYAYEPKFVEKMIDGRIKMVDVGRLDILDAARSYMNHSRVILPSQVEVMTPENPASREIIRVGRERVPRGKVIVGFGEETIRAYADTIAGSRSTFWNGPMDVDGTPQKIIEALAQAQHRGPLFVGEVSADAAKAAGLSGSVYFSSNDLSKFLDDKATNGGRRVTAPGEKDLGNGSRVRGEENLGGINLDPKLLDLQIKRDGNGVPLPLPQQPVGEMHIEGFIPIIINITPVTDLPLLLGLADTGQDADETSPQMKAREPEEISVLN